jgi:hypothetical protein
MEREIVDAGEETKAAVGSTTPREKESLQMPLVFRFLSFLFLLRGFFFCTIIICVFGSRSSVPLQSFHSHRTRAVAFFSFIFSYLISHKLKLLP